VNIVSVNTSTASRLYRNCQSLVQDHQESVGLSTDLTSHCLVAFKACLTVSKPTPMFWAIVVASMPSRCSVTHMPARLHHDA
jgi:hypothetical protein